MSRRRILTALIPLTLLSLAACSDDSGAKTLRADTSQAPTQPGATNADGSPVDSSGATPVDQPAVSTPPLAVPGFGSAVLDLQTQKIFGFGVGPASSDQVKKDVSAQMGSVTNDTGWYTLPNTTADGIGDCLADIDSRVLRWGDLSIAFWKADDGTEQIWSWSVGDPSVSGWKDRREPNIPASPERSGLRTTTGIGVGSTFTEVSDAYGDQFQFIPLTPDDASGIHLAAGALDQQTGSSVSMLEKSGFITGIGATLTFC
jgi:hypothetical protein